MMSLAAAWAPKTAARYRPPSTCAVSQATVCVSVGADCVPDAPPPSRDAFPRCPAAPSPSRAGPPEPREGPAPGAAPGLPFAAALPPRVSAPEPNPPPLIAEMPPATGLVELGVEIVTTASAAGLTTSATAATTAAIGIRTPRRHSQMASAPATAATTSCTTATGARNAAPPLPTNPMPMAVTAAIPMRASCAQRACRRRAIAKAAPTSRATGTASEAV